MPVRIEDVAPKGAFAYELATRQWIDLFGDWDQAIQRLARLPALLRPKRAAAPDGTPTSAADPCRPPALAEGAARPSVRIVAALLVLSAMAG